MRQTLHAEWTKLRTAPGTGWQLALCVVLTVALSVAATAAARCPVGCRQDLAKLSLTGVSAGQAVVAVVAVLAIGGEYHTGMIRSTLTAVPRRLTVLSAKAFVVAVVVLAAGVLAVLGCLLAGMLILPGNGFPSFSLDGPMLRAAVGSVLYLALVGLLSLGMATVVRDSAAAIGIVLGLLFLFPILIQVITDPDWHKRLEKIAPMNAGLSIQATLDVAGLPIGPWQGLGVLGLWAAGALLLGGALLRFRDA